MRLARAAYDILAVAIAAKTFILQMKIDMRSFAFAAAVCCFPAAAWTIFEFFEFGFFVFAVWIGAESTIADQGEFVVG